MTDETAWLDWRMTGLGGSDLARADTGLYGGAYAVVAEKQGRLTSDIEPADAQRGHEWEHAIADGVHALTGYYVHGEQLWVTSPENERWLATIDGLLDHRPAIHHLDQAAAVLEVKTSRQYVAPKWDYYYSQVQWQMLVCGKQRALVAVAVIGVDPDGDEGVRDLKLRWVERDDDKIGDLIDLAERLWAHVEAGTLPDPDEFTRLEDVREVWREGGQVCPDCGGDGKHRGEGRRKNCKRCAGKGVANIDDPPTLVTPENEVERFRDLKEQIALLEAEADELEATIRNRIGEATEVVTTDKRFRVRVGVPIPKFTDQSEQAALLLAPEFSKTVLDRQRFKAEKPELYDELKVPTTDRRLTVKELTEDE